MPSSPPLTSWSNRLLRIYCVSNNVATLVNIVKTP